MTMENVNKTVTTTMGATPAHATLDILAVASMDVWVSLIVYKLVPLPELELCASDILWCSCEH